MLCNCYNLSCMLPHPDHNRRTPPLDTGSQQLSAPLWSWGEVTLSQRVSDWLDKVYVSFIPDVLTTTHTMLATCFEVANRLAITFELKELQTEVVGLASTVMGVFSRLESIPDRLSKEGIQRDNMCRILARYEIPEEAYKLKDTAVKLRDIFNRADLAHLIEGYGSQESGDGSGQDLVNEINEVCKAAARCCESLIDWFDKLSDPHESSGSCELNNTLAWLFSANEGVERHVSLSLSSEKQVVALPSWLLMGVINQACKELERIRLCAQDMPLCELSLEDLPVFVSGASSQDKSSAARLIEAANDADNEFSVMVDCNGAVRISIWLMPSADDAVLDQWSRELASHFELAEAFLTEIGGKLSTGVGRGDNNVGCYVSIHLPRAAELDHMAVGIEVSEEPSYKNLLGGALQPIVFKVCGGSGKGQSAPSFQVQAPAIILRTEEARRWISEAILTAAWLGAGGVKVGRLHVALVSEMTRAEMSACAGEFLPQISQASKKGNLMVRCEWDGHDQKFWAEGPCGIFMRQEMFTSTAVKKALLGLAGKAEIRSLCLPPVYHDEEDARVVVGMLNSAGRIAAGLWKMCGGKPVVNLVMEKNRKSIELPFMAMTEISFPVPTLRVFTTEGLQVYLGRFLLEERGFLGSVQDPVLISRAISAIDEVMRETYRLQDGQASRPDDPYVEQNLVVRLTHFKVLAPMPFISQLVKFGQKLAPGADIKQALFKMFNDDWTIVESQRGKEWLAIERKTESIGPAFGQPF
ncbi:MAG: hypothetical protein GX589_01375 [Deltaproteobacteria bacterium]|nr:hypothetical protein [Deltaproteobacteria bacterium]